MTLQMAVVGGGSVGTSFLFHLVRARQRMSMDELARQRPLSVWVFEPNEALGPGSAYADDLETNLLNVPAGNMSVAEDDRLHFLRWLENEGITEFRNRSIGPASFLPRPLFGRYLKDVAQATCGSSSAVGIQIRHVKEAAIAIHDEGEGMLRVCTNGGSHLVSKVILVMGNLPAASFRQMQGAAGYLESPYPTRALVDVVPPDSHVCILGTSLSAVDAVAALAHAGHKGTITCVSRNGRLPAVRGLLGKPVKLSEAFREWLDTSRQSRKWLSLDEVIRAFVRELALHGVELADVARLVERSPSALAFLRSEIASTTGAPRLWQAVSNSLNELIDDVWGVMSDEGKRAFERDWRSIWMARRVSFPAENALLLADLLESGQLEIRGGFTDLTYDAVTRRFLIRCGDSAPELVVGHVVNATSFSSDPSGATDPLLRQLLSSGMGIPDEFGGFQLDFGSARLRSADGDVSQSITVLGTLAAGTYFWTNSMDVNARLARRAAERIVGECALGEAMC